MLSFFFNRDPLPFQTPLSQAAGCRKVPLVLVSLQYDLAFAHLQCQNWQSSHILPIAMVITLTQTSAKRLLLTHREHQHFSAACCLGDRSCDQCWGSVIKKIIVRHLNIIVFLPKLAFESDYRHELMTCLFLKDLSQADILLLTKCDN